MPLPTDELTAAYFGISDIVRRTQANVLTLWGMAPRECDYRVIKQGAFWRLRDYAGTAAAPGLLIVAAPIKRPYIWDLAPAVSVIRNCLRHGLHVYLLEWLPPADGATQVGLDDYIADALDASVAIITDAAQGARPALIGHSLGGTLAALYGAFAPERTSGLVLLSAPLCFAPGSSDFRDQLVALARTPISEEKIIAGSLLSHMSATASPATFLWSRWRDAALCIGDPSSVEMHGRVERWSLDEMAVSAKLVNQILQWLYAENRFCSGSLSILGRPVGPFDGHPPILAVVNAADDVAPAASIAPFLAKLADGESRLIEQPGEVGVVLQHLAALVGRRAHAALWPEIISWIKSRA